MSLDPVKFSFFGRNFYLSGEPTTEESFIGTKAAIGGAALVAAVAAIYFAPRQQQSIPIPSNGLINKINEWFSSLEGFDVISTRKR